MINFLRGTKALVCLLLLSPCVTAQRPTEPNNNTILSSAQSLENYSFDFSNHKLPKAYEYFGASVQLHHSVKLIPDVASRQGAIVLKKVSAVLLKPLTFNSAH